MRTAGGARGQAGRPAGLGLAGTPPGGHRTLRATGVGRRGRAAQGRPRGRQRCPLRTRGRSQAGPALEAGETAGETRRAPPPAGPLQPRAAPRHADWRARRAHWIPRRNEAIAPVCSGTATCVTSEDSSPTGRHMDATVPCPPRYLLLDSAVSTESPVPWTPHGKATLQHGAYQAKPGEETEANGG